MEIGLSMIFNSFSVNKINRVGYGKVDENKISKNVQGRGARQLEG